MQVHTTWVLNRPAGTGHWCPNFHPKSGSAYPLAHVIWNLNTVLFTRMIMTVRWWCNADHAGARVVTDEWIPENLRQRAGSERQVRRTTTSQCTDTLLFATKHSSKYTSDVCRTIEYFSSSVIRYSHWPAAVYSSTILYCIDIFSIQEPRRRQTDNYWYPGLTAGLDRLVYVIQQRGFERKTYLLLPLPEGRCTSVITKPIVTVIETLKPIASVH